MSHPVLIIKTGSKLPSLAGVAGDYETWIARGLDGAAITVCDVSAGQPLPPPQQVARVVITGSGAMVTDRLAWSEATAAWLREALAAGTPLLGICYGHQLLAHALGGAVDYNPAGLEVGTVEVTLTAAGRADRLLGALPPHFAAQVSHQQSVVRLPAGARILARSVQEPHQAVAYGERAWGVQFHPEFDAAIVRHYVDYYREHLGSAGRDPAAVLAAVDASAASAALLARFATLT